MTKVAIIIANFNQPELTLNTIASLKKINSKDIDYHIFLVDNGSISKNLLPLEESFSNDKCVTLITSPINTGFTGGNNLGVRQALKDDYEYFLLINNDTIVKPDFLQELLKPFKNHKNIGIVAPKIYFAPGYEYHKDWYTPKQVGKIIWSAGGYIDWNNVFGQTYGLDEFDAGQYDQPRSDLEFISGCCLLIKRQVFEKIGDLCDDYFLYFEDVDFCYRTHSNGFKIYYQPTSVIWHLNSGSSQSGGGAVHDYFLTRNRLIFGFRYAKLRTKFALFRESMRILFNGTHWQKIAIVDYYLHKFNRGSWK